MANGGGELASKQQGLGRLLLPSVSLYGTVRVLLAVVLLVATALKGFELATEPTAERDLLTARWFLIAVVEFEFFAALWLFSGICPRWTRRFAIVGFSLFACVSLHKGLTGAVSCGCFGRLPISPWLTFVIDSLAVSALARTRPMPSEHYRPAARELLPIPLALIGMFWLLVAIPSGLLMAAFTPTQLSSDGEIISNDRIVVLEPETWIGKHLPLVPHIDIGKELAQGEWLIVLYHHDCPKCQSALPTYERTADILRARRASQKVALIEIPPFGAETETETPHCRRGRLSNNHEWFVTAPAEILVRQGVVIQSHID